MLDGAFRPWLEKRLEPLAWLWKLLGWSPQVYTGLGLLSALIASFLLAFGHQYWALALWLLGRLFDGLDGIVARQLGQASQWGAYLDILADMSAYGCFLLGFAVWKPEYSLLWLALAVSYTACITGVLAFTSIQKTEEADLKSQKRKLFLSPGLAEAGETSVAYSVFILFPQSLPYALWVWLSIVLYTTIMRAIEVARALGPVDR